MASCEWHPEGSGRSGGRCPVPCEEDLLSKWEGKTYCPLHFPLRAFQEKPKESVRLLISWMAEQGTVEGVELPRGSYIFRKESVYFINCRFSESAVIVFQGKYINFSKCHFGVDDWKSKYWSKTPSGSIKLSMAANSFANFRGSTSTVPLEIDSNGSSVSGVVFYDHRFYESLKIDAEEISRSMEFFNVEFHGPLLCNVKKLPQRSRFDKCRFRRSAHPPSAESSYRQLKKSFGELKYRALEGFFYSLEQRSRRLGLGGVFEFRVDRIKKHKNPFYNFRFSQSAAVLERSISKIYDLSSGYGQSYERAFFMFVCVQVIFGIYYGWIFGRLGEEMRVDWELVIFTLRHVVKPFDTLEPMKLKLLSIDPSLKISVGYQLAAIAHAAMSIVVGALFTLALRWRFIRG